MNTVNYHPTKMVLHHVVPRIIKAYRIPGGSDGTPGRRTGDANADERAGAADILYHLMRTDSIAWMAKRLGVSRQRMYDTLDMSLHNCDERGEYRTNPNELPPRSVEAGK